MFRFQLREKYLHLGVDLLCTAHIQPKCRKNLHQKKKKKKLQTWTLSTQLSGFVVHKLKFVSVSTLRDKSISLV